MGKRLLQGALTAAGAELVLVGATALGGARTAVADLGREPDDFTVFTTRTIGTVLVTLGLTDLAVALDPRAGARLAGWSNVGMNAVLAAVDASAARRGTITGARRGIALHAVIATVLVAALAVAGRPGAAA